MRIATTPAPADNLYVGKLCTALGTLGVGVETLTVRRLLTERYDIVHLHWPEWQLRGPNRRTVAWRSSALLAGLAVSRARGARVVWTVHNLEPHEDTPRRLSVWYWRALTSMVDGVVSPGPSGVGPLRERHRRLADRPTAVIPIGHLRGEYPDHGSRRLARERLGISSDATVLTCFGLLRPYKGVPALIRAVRGIDDPLVLIVAGRPFDRTVVDDVRDASQDDPRIVLRLGHVPDDQVQDVMRAADVVVLPYARSSNSFVALLALSFDRPIIAPAIGAFPELADQFGPGWVHLYRGELTSAGLRHAVDDLGGRGRPPLDMEPLEWSRIAAATRDFYVTLLPE